MLAQNLHRVVGFFGIDRNATGLQGDERVSPERGRPTVPEIGHLFSTESAIEERFRGRRSGSGDG